MSPTVLSFSVKSSAMKQIYRMTQIFNNVLLEEKKVWIWVTVWRKLKKCITNNPQIKKGTVKTDKIKSREVFNFMGFSYKPLKKKSTFKLCTQSTTNFFINHHSGWHRQRSGHVSHLSLGNTLLKAGHMTPGKHQHGHTSTTFLYDTNQVMNLSKNTPDDFYHDCGYSCSSQ